MEKEEARKVLELLENLRELTKVDKITYTFIPSFQEKSITENGETWLHGSFRLGGTKSGRLSSASPNLQQLPSTGTDYAKTIKRAIKAPTGWIFVGSDFSSREDRISALTTKDPNKLKPYIDGYDGHCLRAHAYFGDQMSGIDDSVESINSIEKKYPKLRQDSKTPTFAPDLYGHLQNLNG